MVQEATYDAGKVPQYLRVDFLVDKQGAAKGVKIGRPGRGIFIYFVLKVC